MILSEKIISLRKKIGWSQEELAEKLNVSRQAVSKWESSASIPDINKIIEMSRLFDVSTDYLLKDEINKEIFSESDEVSLPRLSLEDANSFMEKSIAYGKRLALGVSLCIISPVLLIVLGGASDTNIKVISEGAAAGIGITVLLLLVAAAVMIFILGDTGLKKYEHLKKGEFEPDYGVTGIVNEKSNAFEPKMKKSIALNVALCIVSPLPLIIAGACGATDMTCVLMTALLLVVVSFAVHGFVSILTEKGSYDCLLRKEEYDPAQKESRQREERLGAIYWPCVTAVYLAVSFLTDRWDISWLVWPVAGLLYAAIAAIVKSTKS